jgi:hypothetical protein
LLKRCGAKIAQIAKDRKRVGLEDIHGLQIKFNVTDDGDSGMRKRGVKVESIRCVSELTLADKIRYLIGLCSCAGETKTYRSITASILTML